MVNDSLSENGIYFNRILNTPVFIFSIFFKRTEQYRVLRDCLLDHINNKVSVLRGYDSYLKACTSHVACVFYYPFECYYYLELIKRT